MKIRTFLTMFALVTAASGQLVLAQNGRGRGTANKPQTPAHTTGKPAETPAAQNTHPATPKANAGNPNAPVRTTTPTTVRNPQLEQHLQPLLHGLSVADASAGFKNWGQFVAAVHVSNNLNIPFTSLKAKMTGPSPMSLGEAIQTLKTDPTLTPARITTEVRRAESEADEDFRANRNDHNDNGHK